MSSIIFLCSPLFADIAAGAVRQALAVRERDRLLRKLLAEVRNLKAAPPRWAQTQSKYSTNYSSADTGRNAAKSWRAVGFPTLKLKTLP